MNIHELHGAVLAQAVRMAQTRCTYLLAGIPSVVYEEIDWKTLGVEERSR